MVAPIIMILIITIIFITHLVQSNHHLKGNAQEVLNHTITR